MCILNACTWIAFSFVCCRLRRNVDYWKEQAGFISADAKAAADLYDIENRRCDSPAPSESMGTFNTPPSAMHSGIPSGIPSGLGSTCSSRPGTGFSRGMGPSIAMQLQAAAADVAAPLGEPETDAGSIAGEQDSLPPPSSRSTGSASESEL